MLTKKVSDIQALIEQDKEAERKTIRTEMLAHLEKILEKRLKERNGHDSKDLDNSEKEQAKLPEKAYFYMTRALSDGVFTASAKRDLRDESTYFTFHILPDFPHKAIFSFTPFDNIRTRKAYENRRETIENACDLNIDSKVIDSCECYEQGEAELRGNEWIVTKKAKVRY